MELNNVTATTEKEEGLFLSAPFKGKNAFWRYLTLTVAPFVVSNVIGVFPLLLVLILSPGAYNAAANKGVTDFAAMGIDLNLGFTLTLFPFILAFLTFAFMIRPLNERSLVSVINGSKKVRWGRIFVAAAVWTVISGLYLYFSVRNDPANFELKNTSHSLLILSIIAITLIPFQAGFEEILFRGYLAQGFAVLSRNRWVPVLATSVLFGLMHSLNPEVKEYGFFTMIPQYIFFGLVFSVLTMMDDGVELAIGAHTANNVFLSIFVTNKDSALQTPAMYEQVDIYPWRDFAGLVMMSVVFIAVMAITYKWRDIRKLYAKIAVPVVS